MSKSVPNRRDIYYSTARETLIGFIWEQKIRDCKKGGQS
jgi:hypothetical protein